MDSSLPGFSIHGIFQTRVLEWAAILAAVTIWSDYGAPKNELICSLLMKEEGEKAGLKLNIQNTNMASGPITPWQIDGETTETVADYFLGIQNHCRW